MYKLFLFFSVSTLGAQILNPVSNYGWLDQYSMDAKHHFVGNEACEPTSSVNAMTYLQNVAPFIFGTTLTGSTYQSWMATDDTLISIMGTEKVFGTYNYRFVYGLNEYITEIQNYPEVQFSGMFPKGTWSSSTGYPRPSYIIKGEPTAEFITNAIAAGSAVLLSLEYPSGGGHEVVVNGLTWDSINNEGTIYFVDPLDPSVNYSPEVPLGPVKQTSGNLTLSNGVLELTYDQYHGRLPYDDYYYYVSAFVDGVLSVGGGAFTPFANLVTGKNAINTANAFDALDPTTSSMFPILAVLNTAVDLEAIFEQIDPSIYTGLHFTEQNTAEQIRIVLTNNFIQYRHPCFEICQRGSSLNLFVTPFGEGIHQWGERDYKNRNYGVVAGVDYFMDEFLFGTGFSYAHSQLRGSIHSQLQSYGGFLYSAWTGSPLFIDAFFALSNSRVEGERELFGASSNSFIPPFSESFKHRYHSNTLTAHLGAIYDLYWKGCFNLFPFLNLDYIYVYQPTFTEEGGGVFTETILRNWTHLIRSEAGLGFSYFLSHFFLNTTLSYANVSRFDGKGTFSYFNLNPDGLFETYGFLPQNNLVCPSLQIGYRSHFDLYCLSVNYRGEYSSRFISNQFSLELSLGF